MNKLPRSQEFRERVSSITRGNWMDPEVRERRSTRYKCMVNGVVYPSVLKAFIALGLDPAHHTTVRKRIVRDGAAEFAGYVFYVRLI